LYSSLYLCFPMTFPSLKRSITKPLHFCPVFWGRFILHGFLSNPPIERIYEILRKAVLHMDQETRFRSTDDLLASMVGHGLFYVKALFLIALISPLEYHGRKPVDGKYPLSSCGGRS